MCGFDQSTAQVEKLKVNPMSEIVIALTSAYFSDLASVNFSIALLLSRGVACQEPGKLRVVVTPNVISRCIASLTTKTHVNRANFSDAPNNRLSKIENECRSVPHRSTPGASIANPGARRAKYNSKSPMIGSLAAGTQPSTKRARRLPFDVVRGVDHRIMRSRHVQLFTEYASERCNRDWFLFVFGAQDRLT